MAELRRVGDVVAHPRAAGLGPVAPCRERLQRVGHARSTSGWSPTCRHPRCCSSRRGRGRPLSEAAAVADEAGHGADGAALADDHGLALGLDVPDVGQRQRQHLAGIELVVGLLRLAGDAVEQVVDGEAVRARLGAGAEVGVADGGQRRYRRHVRLAVPGASGAQPRQRRQDVAIRVEVVGARAVEHQQRDHARPRGCRCQRLAERPADRGGGRRRAEQRRQRRRHVLLRDALVPDQRLDERRPVQQQRDVGVVRPGRAVHEGVERVAIDDELALARHHEQLAAAAGEVAAGELPQPGVTLGRRRRDRPRSGRCGAAAGGWGAVVGTTPRRGPGRSGRCASGA